jgi:hypothetical protein
MANARKVADLKWSEMSALQRLVFVGKTCIFFMTAGFVFPTVLD